MKTARQLIRGCAGTLPETVRFGRVSRDRDYTSPVLWDAPGNDVVSDVLRQGAPCLVTRLGLSELLCISYYSRWRRLPIWQPRYPPYSRELMCVNAGYFPGDDDALDRFARRFLDDTAEADVMAVWFNRGEARVVRDRCPRARLVELGALNSMCYPDPWSAALEGKSVLVVHPFAKSIETQYRDRREVLFENRRVLPKFELKTLIPVQSIAGNECGYSDWFAALDATCDRIAAESFDIAVIGAGAYGLPLGAFVKRLGRQAVHMGGATQILFGIRGRRWEREYADTIVPLFNPYWVRPLPEETPENAVSVESGCYW